MLYSSNRKLNLSAWLLNNNKSAFDSPLKLQKFVLFYELFSRIDGEHAEFDHLRGWKRGPVFSNLWGDYTKDNSEFLIKCKEINDADNSDIDMERVQLADFIVSILNENELSNLTHELNLWSAKKDRILSGEQQVNLDIEDFSDDDVKLLNTLREMYPIDLINNIKILPISNYNILISDDDYNNLTEEHMDVLSEVVENGGLHNPVYVEIDENGAMDID
ncbi:hypothetical protein [Anaerococcus urinomassiliensis]|uniref:hypothetical protein n=1 Tax=Anaerococcus urinomassiliensis TaxID=1745712 RepID=UPI00093A06DE|nr:hypothetical protein [Anaerococcus urinomassiliensis]